MFGSLNHSYLKNYARRASNWKRAAQRLLVAVIVSGAAFAVHPKVAKAQGAPEYKPLKINLGDDGQYFRFLTWAQVWGRYIQNNPGTLYNGREKSSTTDIGLRRVRFMGYGQVTPNVLVMLHVGIDNQTFTTARKPQLFVHAAWTEYKVLDKMLSIGGGLHYWHGLSRMTNASTLNFLALDAPITNWPTIEKSDQFARNLGIYAKGQISKLDYRVALNKPFATVSPVPAATPAVGPTPLDFATDGGTMEVAGYFNWQFFDAESNLLPYTVGTYLGSKKVFNIGAGFQYLNKAMASMNAPLVGMATGTTNRYDIKLFALDVFADLPMAGGSAFTGYAAFYNYDFGPNYVRNVGIMNDVVSGLAVGSNTFNGPGNAYPSIGTGQHVYAQAGYLLPGDYGGLQIQPYVTGQFSHMPALADPATTFEVGANWLVVGHTAKITTHYRNRPVFATSATGGKPFANSRGSEVIIQSMMYF